jgi:dephospho-CoA kinase
MHHLIIGFSGHIGSGKNYIAEHIFLPRLCELLKLNNLTNHLIMVPYFFSFGDHMKVECLCRNSYKKVSQIEGYHNYFVEKNQSTRESLQKYGTENGRNVHHTNIWVRAVDTWINIQLDRIKSLNNYLPVFIISDVRFLNETDYIKTHNGIIIRVDAPDRSLFQLGRETNNNIDIMNKISTHISETELDGYEFDYNINNDYQNVIYLIDNIDDIIRAVICKNFSC